MDQEIKAKWVEALRSGEYKQGKYALKSNGKFCCLGVLCEVYNKETGESIEYNSKAVLPRVVRDWAGLKCSTFIAETPTSRRNVIVLNDSLGLSFSKIADIIEVSEN